MAWAITKGRQDSTAPRCDQALDIDFKNNHTPSPKIHFSTLALLWLFFWHGCIRFCFFS